MQLRSHLWADLTRSEIAEARHAGALVVIPVGATEQHSEHLPVGTDSFTSGAFSLMAAEACDYPVLVTPTVFAAFSPHHASWPGTLTLKLATISALLEDITASIERAGFKRQLMVNGHGGNRGPLTAISTELITAGREVGYVDYFAPPRAEFDTILKGSRGGVTHSGEAETALMMSLHQSIPGRADLYREKAQDRAPRNKATYWLSDAPNAITQAGAWWPPIYAAGDVGYNGDPAAATLETGNQLSAAIVEKLAAFFAAFAAADLRSGGMER
ncbi:MAG TPA: creatininase family protein [Devosia sp.]|nr:creatininase family protein [Devosia sp.]